MAGILKWKKFMDINLNDAFFDSLKNDYPEFPKWFEKKQKSGADALVYIDDEGVAAFLYLKEENEEIVLSDKTLCATNRLKIGTFKLSERIRGSRQGEGTLGVALWRWQSLNLDEIYVTVFSKQDVLIKLLERFGFKYVGQNRRGENVYIKNRKNLDFFDSYKSFPFIKKGFGKGFLLPIDDEYHDKLFPYSELLANSLAVEEIVAGNGVTKIFIGFPSRKIAYSEGKPILVYRIHTGNRKKTFASCVTSICTIQKIIWVKQGELYKLSLEDFKKIIGNKAVFPDNKIDDFYKMKSNIVVIEMLYNGFFGKGHNVTHHWLNTNGLFKDYPYNITYSEDEVLKILSEASVNVQNVIVD